MIKSRHNKLYLWFFRNYFGMLRAILFREITVVSEVFIPENRAVLLFQNHFSWWDGYWSYWLSRKIFHRKFHVMMLENQLRKRMFLNRCGVFSIQKNSRDFLNSLQYASEVLNSPKNLVAIYPSGVMLTQHQQKIHFQKGIDRIISGRTAHFEIVLAVFLIDYFGFVRPEIRIYLEIYSGERTTKALQTAYNSFYQSCVAKQTE